MFDAAQPTAVVPRVATRLTPEEIPAVLAKHANMCWRIAHKLHARNPLVEIDDIHSEVQLAVVRAAGKFDPARGIKFITYAYRAGHREATRFCLRERANGFHLPDNALVGHAPPGMLEFNAEIDVAERPPGSLAARLPADFWAVVTRQLPSRKKAILLAHFRDGEPQKAIAGRFGITKQRVSQIVRETLLLLKKRRGVRELIEPARTT